MFTIIMLSPRTGTIYINARIAYFVQFVHRALSCCTKTRVQWISTSHPYKFILIISENEFWCLLDIVPIKNEKSQVVLFLVSHKDITKDRTPSIVDNNNKDESESSGGKSECYIKQKALHDDTLLSSSFTDWLLVKKNQQQIKTKN